MIPTTLSWVIGVVITLIPFELSKVVYGEVDGEVPNNTEATGVLLVVLYKLTWSPPVPKPTPLPV